MKKYVKPETAVIKAELPEGILVSSKPSVNDDWDNPNGGTDHFD